MFFIYHRNIKKFALNMRLNVVNNLNYVIDSCDEMIKCNISSNLITTLKYNNVTKWTVTKCHGLLFFGKLSAEKVKIVRSDIEANRKDEEKIKTYNTILKIELLV